MCDGVQGYNEGDLAKERGYIRRISEKGASRKLGFRHKERARGVLHKNYKRPQKVAVYSESNYCL
jgi:hypothetical protein